MAHQLPAYLTVPLWAPAVGALVVVASCSVVNAGDEPVAQATGGGGGSSSTSSGGGAGGDGLSGGGGGIPAGCGDGETVSPEECDDEGESATCDADCTAVECQDGEHNATAGEECDDGAESADCDADCTLATCGDGTLNTARSEGCDDGNILSDDGCSEQCVVEGTCGQPVHLDFTDNAGVLTAHVTVATGGPGTVAAAACDGQQDIGQGSDRVYWFSQSPAANVAITVISQDFDAVVRLQTAACDPTTEVVTGVNQDGCSDLGDVGVQESLTYPTLPSGTYYVVVDGAGATDEGAFILDVVITPL